MTPLTDDEVRWLVNSHTCSLEMVGDTCRVCWLGNERAALLAENARLVAGLESIAKEGTSETADGTMLAPGALQARIVLDGSTRPLERYTEKIAALLAERDALKMDRDYWQGATRVLRSELAALKIENDEADALNTMLSRILTDTAHVLKGTPEALHSHSWADLAQVAAALKERAERVQEQLRDSFVTDDGCDLCELEWRYSHDEHHSPGCICAPDFLTTSATESRGAKGGTT